MQLPCMVWRGRTNICQPVTVPRSLLMKLNFPCEEQEQTVYLWECITVLTDWLFDDVSGRVVVGLKIRNTENIQDRVVGISLSVYTD